MNHAKRVAKWSLVVLGLMVVAGMGIRAAAQNAAGQNAGNPAAAESQPRQQGQMMMQCPMMQALQSLELAADAPPVLLAQEEQLKLTAEQKEQLKQIAQSARQQARQLLNEEQRQQLADAPSGSLSPMQLAQMLAKPETGQQNAGQAQQGKMCPMCQQMMQKRMRGRQGQGNQGQGNQP